MGRDLNELASYFLPKAQALLDACAAADCPVRVVDTGRTPQEQTIKLAQGVSWIPVSKHEPQPPEGKSEAIDIVPLSVLEENKPNWDPGHPDWKKIGAIGKSLGLRWGGDWVSHPDPSHFEYVHPPAQIQTDPELSTT